MFVAAMGAEGEPHVDATRAAAARSLGRRRTWWSKLVVRAKLADGTWEEVLDDARAHNRRIAALVVTDTVDDDLVRRTFARGVALTCPPLSQHDLSRFFRGHGRLATDDADAVATGLEEMSFHHALKPAQRRLLSLALEGRSRRDIATELDLSENTVKTHVRELLRRCGRKSMSDLAMAVLRLALPPAARPEPRHKRSEPQARSVTCAVRHTG